ncbi:peptidase M2 family protein [Altererythrobacter salegens]|uniref:Peptidase M2 family protein n=1 Tax=Croceibacterium salegens TaxID=1737568 RepID=A0A6I4SXT6_9SPHN|nr:M2 family metallopeptidase [Croceibacterium salegens]MXO59122.1 peptidase M2 family protein [Croceibacterium salegens]
MRFRTFAGPLALAISICVPTIANAHDSSTAPAYPLTPKGAADFVAAAEKDLFDWSIESAQADWVNATYITVDTDALSSRTSAVGTEKQVRYANEAARFANVPGLDPDVRRKLDRLRLSITKPAPTTPGAAQELNDIGTSMSSAYGKGQAMLDGKPIPGVDAEAEMGKPHTPDEYKEMWSTWHDSVGAPMKGEYEQFVTIMNEGAQELGYADTGALWRSNYDMKPEEFAAMTERIWQDVKPLYMALHTYVRSKLNEKYGDAVQPKTGPIRADLLGNMWAQEWGNIYPLVAPEGVGDIGYEVGDLLKDNGKGPLDMVRYGENFYKSIGLDPLPETFWERSMFVKPADREVVCHASAWDLNNVDDLRIKMCIKVNSDDFTTIHHELGHNYYQRAYNKQPYLYLEGANDGFHEAIGDFIALSITPQYLVDIGLLDKSKVPAADKDIGLLLRQALDKVAFMPFSLIIDKWRWGVFDGSITPDHYNDAWVGLKREYQGITPPVARPASAFDPGAKYHIPANTPYMRYYLARVLQFQFYKAACDQAGWKGPLHRCSFYGNKKVGENLDKMLAMGASKPWPDALEAFTGEREISGKAMVEYFAPLKKWLDEQNKGKPEGW